MLFQVYHAVWLTSVSVFATVSVNWKDLSLERNTEYCIILFLFIENNTSNLYINNMIFVSFSYSDVAKIEEITEQREQGAPCKRVL